MITEDVYILPASFAQQRLWILSQLDQSSFAYNVGAVVRLSGKLNVDALERSLNEIVRRHEILRTTFTAVDGQPMQVIAPRGQLQLAIEDLSHISENERDAEAMSFTAAESQLPFDLSIGPLLRATLLRLGRMEHLLLLFMHHIVSDGWSMGVLFKELSALYTAYQAGEASPLEELTIQYADYAQWQRERLSGQVLERQLAYWKEHLRGAPALLELPSDRPRPAVQSYRGSLYHFVLGAELTRPLKQLSQSAGVTLYMTLLAGFTALLSRYSGQEEVVVGTPIANRTRAEVERLIGFFVNTLVLHTDFQRQPTFAQALERVKEVCLAAYSHQDMPFEKLVEALEPERSLSYNPLFQVMFVLQNMPAGNLELPGLNVQILDRGKGHATVFDLTLSIDEREDRLKATLQYNTDLFDETTIRRLAGHYRNLLEAAVEDSRRRVAELPLLTSHEERQLLVEWNETATAYPESLCVHELFEAQVERTPEAIALVFQNKELTYRELNRRANQVAHYLIARGVKAETLVGLCMDRCEDLVVTLLGILKAGGAYVPMDPGYPRERLLFMAEDADLSLLLTKKHLLTVLPDTAPGLVCIDTEWPLIQTYSDANPEAKHFTSQLAYVIYTSGSTGKPKGVAITHRSAVAFLAWSLGSCDAEHLRGVLASTSICFDLSVFELFAPLSSGGKIVLAENALQLPELARANEVTLINTVPSAMAELLRLRALPRSVRRVNLAGEALSRSLVEEIYEFREIDEVWNLYGPSEDTTYSTAAVQTRGGLQRVTIGRPVSNTQAYVLDKEMQPAPIGVPGELYLGGAGLARGYFKRPELTAERFIPNPFATAPGSRLYHTGDLVRYLANGELEFLGRADHQVKLRGFRIELGEIEAVIGEHDRVSEVVVVERADQSGEKRLVAYVVAVEQLESSDLRRYAQQRLPEHMVPSAFVLLDRLPLNANGKVDRGALPEVEQTRQLLNSQYEAPRTPIEEILVGLWHEVLGVERLGIHDNFFEAGGHSLLATRLVARVRQCFETELPLRVMFEAPTVAALAEIISATGTTRRQEAASPLSQSQRPASLPLSFSQERLWLLDQLEPGSPAYNIPVAARLAGPLNSYALQRALNEIVRRHEALRTVFVAANGRPAQVVRDDVSLTLPVDDLSQMATGEREAAVARIAKEAAHSRFDLTEAPLLSARLLRVSANEHTLLLTLHHIVGDGWSIGVLFKELSALYESYRQGQPSPLPELQIQYPDYALWQREWLSGEVFEQKLAYWKEQLGEAPAVLELPTDRARPSVQSFDGAQHHFSLGEGLTNELKRLSRSEGVTLFMTLLAGFKVLLSRYSRQEEIVVGTPVANRTRAEVEGLIGFFVNTIALRTEFHGDPGFKTALRSVKKTCIGGFTHQDMPFEKLVEALDPERSLSHNPLFQVMFALQSNLVSNLEQSSLSMTSVEVDNEVAKFDLSLYLVERDLRLVGFLEYNTDLFDRETIARMSGHYLRLMEAVATDPGQRISALPLLSDAEERQLISEWNDTSTDFPLQKSFSELFEARVKLLPEAIAAVTDDEQLSYRELNRRANKLARAIANRDFDPSSPVAVLTGRGMDWLIAVLALFKAGAIYLPLDPQHPTSRLRQVLEQGRVELVLTTKEFEDRPGGLPSKVLRIDELLPEPNPHDSFEASQRNDVAYVIYTSGSTGVPKGAMVREQGMLNHLYAKVADLKLNETDIVAQTASQCFDISVWQLLAPLLVGGQVRIVSDEVSHDPSALFEFLQREKITILETVPSLLASMVNEMTTERLSLRWLIVTGEALNPELCRRWLASNPDIPLLNAYGPTECSDDVTHHVIAQAPATDAARVPIGRPLANTRLYVVDGALRPAPIGVTGELCVGGKGVGLGYLNDPERTAEVFVPDPFTGEPGSRIYRTGDLARYLADGNIEFLGRLDHQVKLRGFRIELGEIEAVLERHSDVRTCAVVVREDRLIAYVVSDGEAGETETLRTYLKDRLPDYMTPSEFVVLGNLPLTTNGKVDRSALPAPEGQAQELDGSFVAPRSEVEETLAGIWKALLGIERVGVNDNFFHLGGHSLLATQLVSRVKNAFGVKLPLRAVFESPTVARLTVAIVQTLLEEESDVNINQWLEGLAEAPATMGRTLEPEIMDDMEQSLAYAVADFSVPNQRFVDELVKQFSGRINRVLDLGCGSADIPIRLARLLPEVRIVAIDASSSMIQLARKAIAEAGLTDRIEVVRAYLPGLPFSPHSFDTIISNSLTHHLPDPMIFWRDLSRLGTDEAVVFVGDLFRPESIEVATRIVEAAAADEHPLLKNDFYNSLLAAFTVEEVKQQLDDAGLSCLKVTTVSERHWLASGQLSAGISPGEMAGLSSRSAANGPRLPY